MRGKFFLKLHARCGCWRVLASTPLDYFDLPHAIGVAQASAPHAEIEVINATRTLKAICGAHLQTLCGEILNGGGNESGVPLAKTPYPTELLSAGPCSEKPCAEAQPAAGQQAAKKICKQAKASWYQSLLKKLSWMGHWGESN